MAADGSGCNTKAERDQLKANLSTMSNDIERMIKASFELCHIPGVEQGPEVFKQTVEAYEKLKGQYAEECAWSNKLTQALVGALRELTIPVSEYTAPERLIELAGSVKFVAGQLKAGAENATKAQRDLLAEARKLQGDMTDLKAALQMVGIEVLGKKEDSSWQVKFLTNQEGQRELDARRLETADRAINRLREALIEVGNICGINFSKQTCDDILVDVTRDVRAKLRNRGGLEVPGSDHITEAWVAANITTLPLSKMALIAQAVNVLIRDYETGERWRHIRAQGEELAKLKNDLKFIAHQLQDFTKP
jgi:hypothetical protein